MGLLVEGKWVDQWYDTKSTGGKFVRQDSAFRDYIGSEKFAAESGRYHLYVSHACPWAHRTLIFRKLKGLEKVISMSVVDATMLENGWEFVENKDDLNNKKYLREIYLMANPVYTGRVTVPVLWDKQKKTIVSNESAEIIRMFNDKFDDITGNKLDFYPEKLRQEIDKINDFIYGNINNGVYKVGFATSQNVYDEEVEKLFKALDVIEKILSKQRYLIGNVLTEADWRLWTTLLRFDPVYVGHFKCNIKCIANYPNLSNYIRDLYQIQGIEEVVNMIHIKQHYYTSHPSINPNGIIPAGPDIDYEAAHNRTRFEI
jgi:putative glutathione S-transferase